MQWRKKKSSLVLSVLCEPRPAGQQPITVRVRTGYFVNPAFAAREGTPAMSQKVTPVMLRKTAS